MAILKCKMCGGNLNVEDGITVTECEYCGTKQTVPVIDDEKKLKLYERANKLRFSCDFDKAASIYESIVADFPDEAEAYWGLCLCEYGIEYVDDPASGDKVPTCHRSSFDSILDSDNFDLVMENSDPVSRVVYRSEAKAIEELRKGIIEISGKEEPYDIFICYKETDEDGNRTIDSVLAQDVYTELTRIGYRVFFSRITLENILGVEYEPYIFAALNSAKIMLAFGTSYDFYNAVWVKNEWSRFLKIMAKDRGKYLIPCYKNIDAYDIPKEFAKLQAQDLGKVGAIQDLIRGIEKLYPKNIVETKTETAPIIQNTVSNGPSINSLMQRANDELEDKEWDKAIAFFDEVLDMDAQNAYAYLGCALAENHCSSMTEFEVYYIEHDDDSVRFRRAIKYAEGELKEQLNNLLLKKEEAKRAREQERIRAEEEKRRIEEERRRIEEAKRLSMNTFMQNCPKKDRVLSIYNYLNEHKNEYLGNIEQYNEMLKKVRDLAEIERMYGFRENRLAEAMEIIMNVG